MTENDAQRFVRKLVIDGFLDEELVTSSYSEATVIAYLKLSNKGREFLNGVTGKTKACSCLCLPTTVFIQIYLHVSTGKKGKRSSTGGAHDVLLPTMREANEAEALKEKYGSTVYDATDALPCRYRLKHVDIFTACKNRLLRLFHELAVSDGFAGANVSSEFISAMDFFEGTVS